MDLNEVSELAEKVSKKHPRDFTYPEAKSATRWPDDKGTTVVDKHGGVNHISDAFYEMYKRDVEDRVMVGILWHGFKEPN